MNARIEHRLSRPLLPPHDLELEENALGVALLGYPLPDWLEERHFWASQHRFILRHIRELGDKANLPTVAALIRDRGKVDRPHSPNPVTSAELVRMMTEARWAMDMGWAVDWERLRELADRRALQQAAERALIVLDHGGTAEAARSELNGAMGE
jgi:replicative DNA helicase